MPMQGAATLQEYLISLGVQMDTGSMTKLMGFLSSGKLKAAAMGAAFTAAGKAIYGFLKSSYAAEQEMQKLARTQHKSIETIRAQQNALKAMGKTMQEVSKDPALKAMYNDLVKANKAMALPDMRGGISLLRQLQASFYELRSAVRYSMQWINYHMLANLKEPIQRITAFFKQVAEFIRKDINGLTAKLASYLTAFTKGLLGIVEMSVKIADWVHKLPDGIKSAGLAISAVFALLKSGPLGQIMAVITAVGGLIDDYENWQWNKANPDAEQVAVAFPSIWELLDSDDPEKGSKIANKISEKLTDGFNNFAVDLNQWVTDHENDITTAATTAMGFVSNVITGTSGILKSISAALRGAPDDPEFNTAVGEMINTLEDAFIALGEFISATFSAAWAGIYENLPQGMKDVLSHFGYTENEFYRTQSSGLNENGEIVTYKKMRESGWTDAQISEARNRARGNASVEAYDYLLSHGGWAGITFDENGQMTYGKNANWTSADETAMSAAWSGFGGKLWSNPSTAKQYAQAIVDWGNENALGGGNQKALQMNNAIASFFGDKDVTPTATDKLNATLSKIGKIEIPTTLPTDAGAKMLNDLQQKLDAAGSVKVDVEFQSSDDTSLSPLGNGRITLNTGAKKNAWGGRYDRPITTEVAEDGGTEYIIPLSKPARAFALIKQMLGEMGSAATQRLMTDMGLGMAGTNGANAATISSAASGATINNNYNISAPVTIQVTASGADAKEIGTTAYNAAERQLIRSLKGVLA